MRTKQDLFSSISVTNIVSEAAFARARQHASASQGNVPVSPTLASNHVLQQAKMVLDAAHTLDATNVALSSVPGQKEDSTRSLFAWLALLALL